MTYIFRNLIGHDWGWALDKTSAMHLGTLDARSLKSRSGVVVLLERRGVRTFKLQNGTLSANDEAALRSEVEAHRQRIEERWVAHMVRRGWLEWHIEGEDVLLVAYPDSVNRFERRIDAGRFLRGLHLGEPRNEALDAPSAPTRIKGLLAHIASHVFVDSKRRPSVGR